MATTKQHEVTSAGLPSPIRAFSVMLGIIFLLDLGVTLLLQAWLPSGKITTAVNATLLSLLAAPFFWWLVVRPLRGTDRADKVLSPAIIRHAADAIITFDSQGTVQSFNPAAERIFGYRAAEVIGQKIDDLLLASSATEEPGNTVPAGRHALLGGGLHEALGRRRDATTFPLELVVSEITPGKQHLYLALGRDLSARKQVEQALRESDARKGAVLGAAIDCIITLDHKGHVTEINPAVERTLGYRRDEMMGKRLAELIFPPSMGDRDSSRVWQHFATVGGFVLGKPVEITAMRADGTEFPAELAVTSVTLPGTRMFTASLRDITKRKRVEQCLAAQLAVTRILAESRTWSEAAPRVLQVIGESLEWDVGTLWCEDRQARLLRCLEFWQQPALKPAGLEALSRGATFAPGSGLPGRAWSRREALWIADIRRDPNLQGASHLARAGLRGAVSFPILQGNEVLGVLEFFSRRIQPPDKELLRMLDTVGSQISSFIERSRSEEALRESAARFRRLTDDAPVLIWTSGTDGLCDYVNQCWLRFTGRSLAKEIGTGWQENVHPEDAPGCLEAYRSALGARRCFVTEFRYRRRDGAYRHLLAQGSPRFSPDGGFAGFIGSCTDITDCHRAEGEAEDTAEAILRARFESLRHASARQTDTATFPAADDGSQRRSPTPAPFVPATP